MKNKGAHLPFIKTMGGNDDIFGMGVDSKAITKRGSTKDEFDDE
jgi:hypothetical protein